MQYDDEKMPSLENIENMAKQYSLSLKEKGFVFVCLDEEGKKILIDEVFDILFKLRASYRALGNFLDSQKILEITENNILSLRNLFEVETNRGFFVTSNQTKCFLNCISMESSLLIKLLLLSQKCEFGETLLSIIIERARFISKNLAISGILNDKRY